jgi:hypothetical protein
MNTSGSVIVATFVRCQKASVWCNTHAQTHTHKYIYVYIWAR